MAAIHVGGPDPLQAIEHLNRSIVLAARYMRQSIREVEQMSVPDLNCYLRLTSELIAEENGRASPTRGLRPTTVSAADGPGFSRAFAHEESVR